MKYSTLEQILDYVIKNKLTLTPNERTFLINLKDPDYNDKRYEQDKITVDDFIRWYNSPIRKEEITSVLATQTLLPGDLAKLLEVSDKEIEAIIKKYENLEKNDIGYLALNYARLKAIWKTGINVPGTIRFYELNGHCERIIDLLAQNLQISKEHELEDLIQHNEMYYRKDLIEKLFKCNDPRAINNVAEILRKNLSDIDIARKYIELELDGKNEKHIFPDEMEELVSKVKNRRRAKEAILRQDSTEKVNQVLYAALNGGIYKNKLVFDLIQSQTDPEIMSNLRILAKIKRFRSCPTFLESFASLDKTMQEALIEVIPNNRISDFLKGKEEKEKAEKDMEEQIKRFARTDSTYSIKKLAKTLKTNISLYQTLEDKDTTSK